MPGVWVEMCGWVGFGGGGGGVGRKAVEGT